MYKYLILSLFAFPVSADIVARGDFQTKNSSQWHLLRGKDPSRQFGIVESPARAGKRYSAQFIVRDGDQHGNTSGERSEVSNLLPKDYPTDRRDGPGDDYYYAWSTYFPQGFPTVDKWGVITQWHEATGGVGSTNLAVRVDTNQRLVLTHNVRPDSADVKVYQLMPNIETGVWHDFIVRVKWSCGNDGILQLWHKRSNEQQYQKKVDFSGKTAKYTTYCNPVYKLQGFYRSAGNTATHTIYHTGYVQTTTFEEAASEAHGGSVTQPPLPTEPSPTLAGLPNAGWEAVASSAETVAEDGRVENAVDGDVSTAWVSRYSETEASHPHTLTIDMKDVYRVDAVNYYTDGQNLGGELKGYSLFLSLDGENWDEVSSGEFKNQQHNIINITPTKARYLRLVSKSAYPGSYQWPQGAIAAEITVEGELTGGDIVYIDPGQTCVIREQ